MVLLKENQIPIYADVIGSNPSAIDAPHHNNEEINTCKTAVKIDDFQSSLIIVGLSSIPTINNRKLIHKFPKDSKFVFPCNKEGKNRLIAVPAKIYHIIIGCLSTFIIHKEITTTQITNESAKNIDSDIYIHHQK